MYQLKSNEALLVSCRNNIHKNEPNLKINLQRGSNARVSTGGGSISSYSNFLYYSLPSQICFGSINQTPNNTNHINPLSSKARQFIFNLAKKQSEQ